MSKKFFKKLVEKSGYSIVKKKYLYPPDIYEDKGFMDIYKKCKPYTMVAIERSYALYKTVQYAAQNNIRGDFVECGVWKGGQSMLVAYTLLQRGDKERNLWMYDTYAGMPKPTQEDEKVGSSADAMRVWESKNKGDYNEWNYASLEEVQKNILSTGYPKEKIKLIKGKVEETIPLNAPEKISILRLDTDFYESTYHELKHLWPRLVQGGALLIDDYGMYVGSKKAVDRYFKENKIQILLNRMGGGRIGVKIH